MATDLMLIKRPDQLLMPATFDDGELIKKFKVGKELGVTVRTLRNGKFHRKLMALITVVFDGTKRVVVERNGLTYEEDFEAFRRNILILCGFRSIAVTANGHLMYVADSISYDNCSQEKAERIYSAIIDKALELLPRYADAAELDSMVDEIIRFT